jgi:hypothetical protein
MSSGTTARRSTLYAMLGFCQLPESPSFPQRDGAEALDVTWSGIRHVADALRSQ